MSVSIRSRLLLLVLAALLPGLAGVLWIIGQTYEAENQAHERTLRDTARALSMVVERELNQRATVARLLALSRALDDAPQIPADQMTQFELQARRAMLGFDGWVELSDRNRVLLDSRQSGVALLAGHAADGGNELVDLPMFGPMRTDSQGSMHAVIIYPVQREGQTLLNLAVTILPAELQRIIDAQRLPPDWVGVVIDNRGVVVARHPGGTSYAGRPATPDLRARLAAAGEGVFDSVSLDGVPTIGYFSTSAQGWTYLSAMRRDEFGGALPSTVLQVAAGALLLLALAAAGAVWVSRSIVGPVVSLKNAAERMKAGAPVVHQATGIVECDEVASALAEAAEAMQHARADLERQVGEAVERTRAAEQRVAQSQRVEALGRLTGGVAHDFNNLLGVISNSSHLIQRQSGDNPAIQMPLAAMQRAVEVGSRLTQHLLRVAGRQPVRPQQLQLDVYLPDVQELVASVLGQRIQLAVAVAPGTWPITVDSGELELALINLALNARDAMTGGGHVWLHAGNAAPEDLGSLAPGRYVMISVGDDGPGMDNELIERVFEPFVTTKAVGKGTGLGLSQVLGFCTQAGGTARLGSTAGLGTTVSLLLPAGSGRAEAPAPAAASVATTHLAGARVLLVEDNEELADVTAALLRSYGCVVRRADSADQALSLLRSHPDMDVVLSDIVMPGSIDGLGLARQLRNSRPALPVLLISGFSNALAAAGDFIVLHKPYSQAALLQALQRALAPGAPGAPAGAPPDA